MNIQNTLTIVALVAAVVTGLVAMRSNAVKVWRDNSEAEKARNDTLEADLKREKAEAIKIVADLALERSKTDLTLVVQRMDSHHAETMGLIGKVLETVAGMNDVNRGLLVHLVGALKGGPST